MWGRPRRARGRSCRGRGTDGRCRRWSGAGAERRRLRSATGPLRARPGEPAAFPSGKSQPKCPVLRGCGSGGSPQSSPVGARRSSSTTGTGCPRPRHCTVGAVRGARTRGALPGDPVLLSQWLRCPRGSLGGPLSHFVLPVHDVPLPCLPHGLGGCDRSPTNTLWEEKAEERGCRKLCGNASPRMGHLSDVGQQNIPVGGEHGAAAACRAGWDSTQGQLGGQRDRVPKDLAVTV